MNRNQIEAREGMEGYKDGRIHLVPQKMRNGSQSFSRRPGINRKERPQLLKSGRARKEEI